MPELASQPSQSRVPEVTACHLQYNDARMLRLVFGFDVDGYHGVGHLDLELVLNPVTDVVGI